MKRNNFEEKAITLIALVVTIIILLILAGVAIASVTGDNGLFRKAREATNMYKDSEKDEQGVLNQARNEISELLDPSENTGGQEPINPPASAIRDVTAIAGGMNIEISAKATDSKNALASLKYSINPETGIPEGQNEGDLSQDGTPKTITTTLEETYTVTITAIDNVGKTTTKIIENIKTTEDGVIKHIRIKDETTNGTLKAVNTKEIYGADVIGYTCNRKKDDGEADIEWQIFYIDEADNNRVYLISKEYMTPPTNESEVKLIKYNGSSSEQKAYRFATSNTDQSVLGKFSGEFAQEPETLSKFINDYLKDYSSGLNASSSQPNLQATKLMLDQNMWAEYKNENKADLAFGGPTLPLFQKSYNDICKNSTKLGIQKNGTGYQIKMGTGGFVNNQTGYGDISTQKGIYFKGERGMIPRAIWLASPSSYAGEFVMFASWQGEIVFTEIYKYIPGFRPVVSLKSGIQFIDNNNGTYTIE